MSASALSLVRVVVGGCLLLWGGLIAVLFGFWSLSEGNGASLVHGVGLMVAGLLTLGPRSHRLTGVAALAALVVGALLVVAGYKVSLGYTWSGVPRDGEWWLHRLGGAALLVLGGVAIGSLPSRLASREVPG